MNTLFLAPTAKQAYIVKVYSTENVQKIANEHLVVNTLRKLGIPVTQFLANGEGGSYSFGQKSKIWYAIYPYVEGNTPSYATLLEDYEIIQAADELRKLHLAARRNETLFSGIRRRSLRDELSRNIGALRKSLNVLTGTTLPQEARRVLDRVITKKLRDRIDQSEITLLSASLYTLIHADFAPSNIVYRGGTVVCILDWEHACWYNTVWDIFKSICHTCKNSDKGLICTPLNLVQVDLFLATYLGSDHALEKEDLFALKLMPKYYYLLDPFFVASYILEGNQRVRPLVSLNEEDHYWLENNANAFAAIVDKYDSF